MHELNNECQQIVNPALAPEPSPSAFFSIFARRISRRIGLPPTRPAVINARVLDARSPARQIEANS
jgi:hypothetical protein